jgi:hypothetical protein
MVPRLAAPLACALALVVATPARADLAPVAPDAVTTLTGGLDHPRGVTVAGTVLTVAEAGATRVYALGADGVCETDRLPAAAPAELVAPAGAVPPGATATAVVPGPGATTLVGLTLADGTGSVVRVDPADGSVTPVADGLGPVVAVAALADQYVYVLERGTDGAAHVLRVGGGERSELAPGTFGDARGLAVGADGVVYVTEDADADRVGRVVAITPAPRTLAELAVGDRTVRVVEQPDRVELVLDGRAVSQRAFHRTAVGYGSSLLAFERFTDPAALARALVENDGVLWIL